MSLQLCQKTSEITTQTVTFTPLHTIYGKKDEPFCDFIKDVFVLGLHGQTNRKCNESNGDFKPWKYHGSVIWTVTVGTEYVLKGHGR